MELFSVYHPEIPDFLRDAAQTPPMLRLQGVGMNCGCEYTAFPLFSRCRPYSRFDHCLGAALITWHFTGDPHQAMAALLHDIATPVFSHVVDFLKGDYLTQESTESGTEEMILSSKPLMQVLKDHGLDPNLVTDYHRYPIADNDSPRLSADRLEYTLGNIVNFGFGDEDTVRAWYHDLQVGDGELVFTHEKTACRFASSALSCGKLYVCDEDRYAMQILSELLARALDREVLTWEDLHTQESAVIGKLLVSPLADAWGDFCRLKAVRRTQAPDAAARVIQAKKRFIDPLTRSGKRASELDGAFAKDLAAFLAQDFAVYVTAL